MNSFWWPAAATAALFGGPVMFLHGFRTLRIRQLIQNTPTAHIHSMAMGLVEVCGAVTPRSHSIGPFSGKPCAYWEVEVAVAGRRGWTTVHRNASGNPFFLRDATGVALVYPRGALCKLGPGVEERCSGLSLPECYSQYLDQQNLAMRNVWRLSEMRFRERLLTEDQRVYVLGTAMPRPNVVTLSDGEAMRGTGTDGPVESVVAELTRETAAVIRKGEGEPTFVISQESERSLTSELGWEAGARLLGGPALTLYGLGYWLYAMAQHRLF
jgi:hypothetical protein